MGTRSGPSSASLGSTVGPGDEEVGSGSGPTSLDVDKLAALQWRTISLILDLLPCAEVSPYVHELLFHSASVIGWFFL